MQALLAMAGKGTRMRKTHNEPKHLLPVAGKTVIEHFIDKLPESIDELVLITGGPHEEKIKDFFGSSFQGRNIEYVHQAEQHGLGHAFQQAKGKLSGKFLMCGPDDVYGEDDFKRLLEVEDLGVLVSKVDDPTMFGVFVFDENNNLVDAVEKPKTFVSDLINTTCSLMDEEFFDIEVPLSHRGEIEQPDIFLALAKERGRKIEPVITTEWMPINDADQLLAAHFEVCRRLGIADSSESAPFIDNKG